MIAVHSVNHVELVKDLRDNLKIRRGTIVDIWESNVNFILRQRFHRLKSWCTTVAWKPVQDCWKSLYDPVLKQCKDKSFLVTFYAQPLLIRSSKKNSPGPVSICRKVSLRFVNCKTYGTEGKSMSFGIWGRSFRFRWCWMVRFTWSDGGRRRRAGSSSCVKHWERTASVDSCVLTARLTRFWWNLRSDSLIWSGVQRDVWVPIVFKIFACVEFVVALQVCMR